MTNSRPRMENTQDEPGASFSLLAGKAPEIQNETIKSNKINWIIL